MRLKGLAAGKCVPSLYGPVSRRFLPLSAAGPFCVLSTVMYLSGTLHNTLENTWRLMMTKHEPYIFNHSAGTLTVFAPSPKAAIKRAKQVCGDYHHVPAFVVKSKEARV